ncbi:zinc finger B-box domain-containing protein 1 isoform X2 [Numida meleagris]|uniref:zinc finger B-box domain-containing protein 1 isoform X2 n=1 Tax=Numida meleagris TaxID=8996 RepID=UPI000B3E0374|nr:zinc finger B-box domain-containing protein 1 isoform X2 [Numida meleagris]
MNNNNFVILPGSKSGTSVRLKAKTVRELRLEKVQLEMENKEVEKKLRQLQSNMSREKQERKKSSAYHWKSGQAGPMAIQAQFLLQNKEKANKVSSGKVRLQLLKEPIQEPVKEQLKHEMSNGGACEKSEVKEILCGQCEIKNAVLVEASARAGKLRVADCFISEVNLNETNHEEKNSKYEVTSNKSSSSPASAGTAEETSSESAWTGLDNQDKGILLNGMFNEEESAKSFQEALIQWRNNNHDHRQEHHAGGALSESVGNCEVQTSLSVVKEHVQIHFKEDGLSYMEKLLLKKYKRSSVDEMSGSCVKDSRPAQTPTTSHQAVTGGEQKGDAGDIDDLTVEEVRRYWTSVLREEVPRSVSGSAESALKVEFLDDESYDVDLEESCNFLVLEAEAGGMNNQRNIGSFEELGSGSVTADQKNTQADLLPKETVAVIKSSCHSAFTADAQYLLPSPLDGSLVSCKEILQGDGRWFTDRSVSEYADESVVQAVLKSQMNRSSSGLKTQNRISPLVTCRSYSGNDSIRPRSLDVLQHKLTRNGARKTHPRPKSLPVRTSRADTEISKHEYVDVIKEDEYHWESVADQEALLSLEKELQTYIDPQEKLHGLNSEDVTSSSRCSRKIDGNITDFHKTLELKDLSGADMLGGYDEDQIDEKEEILEDKRQVLALQ